MKKIFFALVSVSIATLSIDCIAAVDPAKCEAQRELVNQSYTDSLKNIKDYQEKMIKYSLSGEASDLILFSVTETSIKQQFELLQLTVKFKKACGFD